MTEQLGIPYMGSKRKIAHEILKYIKAHNPQATHFYDLFGGGGAVSLKAVDYFDNVYYNEYDGGVYSLMNKLLTEPFKDEYYKWVTREEFKAHHKDQDWYGGLLKTCWSFGSLGKTYIYGQDIENPKRIIHNCIISFDDESITEFEDYFNIKVNKEWSKYNIEKRKSLIIRKLKSSKLKIDEIENLSRIKRFYDIQSVQSVQSVQAEQKIKKLKTSNHSYDDVEIKSSPEQTVIYCDPPYENTKEYQTKFEFNKFLEFIKKSPYKIYISSYEIKDDSLFLVKEMKKQVTLSATNNSSTAIERLYCNKKDQNIWDAW